MLNPFYQELDLDSMLVVMHRHGYRRGANDFDDSPMDSKETFFSRNRKGMWDRLRRFTTEPEKEHPFRFWAMLLLLGADHPTTMEIDTVVKKITASRKQEYPEPEHFIDTFDITTGDFLGHDGIVVEFNNRRNTITFFLKKGDKKHHEGYMLIDCSDPFHYLAPITTYLLRWRDYCVGVEELVSKRKEMNKVFFQGIEDNLISLYNTNTN